MTEVIMGFLGTIWAAIVLWAAVHFGLKVARHGIPDLPSNYKRRKAKSDKTSGGGMETAETDRYDDKE